MRAARHFGIPPHPAEQVARDATAYIPDGKLWQAKRDDRWPVAVCAIIWAGLLLPIWAGVGALVLWMVR